MSKQPTLTKAQINKLLNCQDMLKSSLQGLAVATKKLNQATANVEKESAGGQISSRGSTWYKKNQNSQAAKDAQNTINNIVKRFDEDMKRLKTNLEFLNSQVTYQQKMNELAKYYKKDIHQDKEKIQELESTRAIANRMSAYYEKKDDSALWYSKYLSIGYWLIIILLSIVILYSLYASGYIYHAYKSTRQAIHRIRTQNGGRYKPYSPPRNIHTTSAKAKNALPSSLGLLSLLLITPKVMMPIIELIKSIFLPNLQ